MEELLILEVKVCCSDWLVLSSVSVIVTSALFEGLKISNTNHVELGVLQLTPVSILVEPPLPLVLKDQTDSLLS